MPSLSLNSKVIMSGNEIIILWICRSTPLVQGDHGNHHVNLKQEKVTSSVKVQCITMSCFTFANEAMTDSEQSFTCMSLSA